MGQSPRRKEKINFFGRHTGCIATLPQERHAGLSLVSKAGYEKRKSMIKNSKPANSLSLHLRLRITSGEKIALGPGKVELLALLEETGSISEASRRMKMSYMKAWSLIQTMKPLVESTRGGQTGGGAKLTENGHKALALYRKMERDSRHACLGSWKKLQLLFPK